MNHQSFLPIIKNKFFIHVKETILISLKFALIHLNKSKDHIKVLNYMDLHVKHQLRLNRPKLMFLLDHQILWIRFHLKKRWLDWCKLRIQLKRWTKNYESDHKFNLTKFIVWHHFELFHPKLIIFNDTVLLNGIS